MMRLRFVAIVIATTLATSGVAAAQVSDATVDQVLATLAEVVKDRAKRVASEAIKEQLVSGLCNGHILRVGAATLKLGGSRDNPGDKANRNCQRDKANNNCQSNKACCTSDDIFAESCRLIRNDNTVVLTDTHFLKLLGNEATAFAIRLAAAELNANEFEEQKLPALADYLFKIMLDMGKSTPKIDAIAQRTLDFADKFGDPNLPEDVFRQLRDFPEVKLLRESLKDFRPAPAICGTLDPLEPCMELAKTWHPDGDADCTPAKLSLKTEGALQAFLNRFSLGKPYEKVRSQPCDAQSGSPPFCDQVQLLIRLEPALHRYSCELAESSSREELRSLTYLLLEKDVYLHAVKEAVPAANEAARKFFEAAHRLTIRNFRREQIARGIRVVGNALRAYASDVTHAEAWLTALENDFHRLKLDAPMSLDSLESLRLENQDKWGARVRLLRDTTKDFLALSLLEGYIAGTTDKIPGLQEAIKGVMNVIDTLAHAASKKPSAEQALGLIADIVGSSADVGEKVEKAEKEMKMSIPSASLPTKVLTDAADLLQDASDRDWVSLAMRISKKIDDHQEVSLSPEARRSIHFIRVLMSMYQAHSQEEAKGVFEAELEDLSSRRERWHQFSVDAGALLGAAVGGLWDSTTTNTDGAFGYGLFAPFGVQFAWPYFGLMLYPVDLGAYLVGRGNTQTTPAPNWHDSLRAGGALYYRPSAKIPVDLGLDFDYHPRFSDRAEQRLLGVVVLELPLFVIH